MILPQMSARLGLRQGPATAQAIYVAAFGHGAAAQIPDFARRVLTTTEGWWLIIVGCGIGFLFALIALCISAVSRPMKNSGIEALRMSASRG